MNVKPAKKGVDLNTDSEVLCPLTIDWGERAEVMRSGSDLAMRRGRFVTSPRGFKDGHREEDIIGYFLNKSTVILVKLDKTVPMVEELHTALKNRGIDIIEQEHLSATSLNRSGSFIGEICLWSVAPGLVIHPGLWRQSEETKRIIKVADSPLKEHLQGMISNMQAVRNGIDNAEKLFTLNPSLKEHSAPSIM